MTIQFPLLKTDSYLAALETAKKNVQKRLKQPEFSTFEHAGVQTYPPILFKGIVVALAGVLLFSFWISAGKQVAASGMMFDTLPDKYSHLSVLWSSVSIVAMLLLSEVGAILFLIAGGILAGNNIVIAWIFRGFAFLCAGYAVVSNVTITLINPVVPAGVLQWLVSIGVPLIVLGLGIMLERMLIAGLHSRAIQTQQYHDAMREYKRRFDDPTLSPDYYLLLSDALWSELTRTKAMREVMLPFSDNPQARKAIVASEHQAHISQSQFNLEGDSFEGFLASKSEG